MKNNLIDQDSKQAWLRLIIIFTLLCYLPAIYGFRYLWKEMKIKNRKYFVIDFNNLLKKPLKEIVSSENAKRLAQSEIEKIIKFGLKSNDL